jgi:hypothetical protein
VKTSDAQDSDYGSVGPMRRIRHKPLAKSSSRGSAYFRSSLGSPSQLENSNVSEGFLPAVKKNMVLGGTSGTSNSKSLNSKPQSSEVGVPMVHPHTNQMARKILEHLDRSQPSPKDKSAELERAATWKKPESSDANNVMSNEHNSLPNSYRNRDQIERKNYALRIEERRSSRFKVGPQESTSEASTDALNKGSLASSVTKPVLPSISISKPESRWPFTSDASSGFSFPVSSSGVEPPTPTIVPSFSAGGVPQQQQPKEGPAAPSYNFGSKRSTPALVFSFPSSSSANIHEDALGIKYSFGSDENSRLSFSSFEKDAVCY